MCPVVVWFRRIGEMFNAAFLPFRRIGITETHNLTGLYPDLEYPIWLAARSQRGEGASTPPIRVRTKPYGKYFTFGHMIENNYLKRGVGSPNMLRAINSGS